MICVDQWRGDALSAAGHPVVRTPHLDELAGQGTRFSRAYSAPPTCVPARVALMTGQSQERHGRTGYREGVPFTEAHPVTMPGVLRGHGYQTQAIGKMHVYPERSRCGFDDVRLHAPFNPPQWAFDQYLHGSRVTPGIGDWIGDFEEFRVDDHHQTVMGRLDPASHHRAMSGYYGNISHIDLQINRLIEGLADFELLEETSIVFVSDHGEMMGDHDMYRKSVGYEGSAHVPMIVRAAPAFFPDAPRGQVVDAVTELRDVMPTVLAMAGVDCPDTVDGLSLLPHVCGEHPDWRSELHGEHVHFDQSLQWVTDGRRKYLWASARGVEQFFDLEADPHELHDLTDEADRAEEVDRWRTTLIDYLSDREEGFVVDGSLVTGRPAQTEARRISALATR